MKDRLKLKIGDWVDDYAETVLGSEYSGRISREECINGLYKLILQAADETLISVVEEFDRDYEIAALKAGVVRRVPRTAFHVIIEKHRHALNNGRVSSISKEGSHE